MPGTPAELLRDAGKAGLYLAALLTIKLHEVPGRIQSPAPVLRHSFYLCTFTVLPKKLSKQNTLPVQRYMAKVSAYMLGDVFIQRAHARNVRLATYSVAEIIAQAPFSHISISVKATVSLSLANNRPELIHFQWKIARELHVPTFWTGFELRFQLLRLDCMRRLLCIPIKL